MSIKDPMCLCFFRCVCVCLCMCVSVSCLFYCVKVASQNPDVLEFLKRSVYV